jgi:hypothetical protein
MDVPILFSWSQETKCHFVEHLHSASRGRSARPSRGEPEERRGNVARVDPRRMLLRRSFRRGGMTDSIRSLRNDIRRDLVFDEGDAVAQLQLALLQPLQPQQIWRGRLMQGIDRRVEIAVLLLQPRELGFEFALIFVGHGVTVAEKRERDSKDRETRGN